MTNLNEAFETVRQALDNPWALFSEQVSSGFGDAHRLTATESPEHKRARAALDSLTQRLTQAEEELEIEKRDVAKYMEQTNAQWRRAEKAERERDEARKRLLRAEVDRDEEYATNATVVAALAQAEAALREVVANEPDRGATNWAPQVERAFAVARTALASLHPQDREDR